MDANAVSSAVAGITSRSNAIQSIANVYELSKMVLPIESLKLIGSTERTNGHNNINAHHQQSLNNSGDLASVDSSDTYASCQTHPFLSQGDLTGDMADLTCTLAELDVDDLYFTTLDQDQPSCSGGARMRTEIKKSASGDASIHSLGAPIEEVFKTFQSFEMASRIDRGSHISLNETPLPKHRKTRFQQSSLSKGKVIKSNFEASTSKKHSHENLTIEQPSTSVSNPESTKKMRRPSFMPSKSLASATKLINQHLFGIQNANLKGKNLRENIF